MTNSYSGGLLGLLGQTDDERRKNIAWNNALPATSISERIDCDGRIIRWDEYGKMTTYGWEIDHAHPIGFGGLDVYGNLRARHWFGNRKAGGLMSGFGLGGLGKST
jgi:hypothetical protein